MRAMNFKQAGWIGLCVIFVSGCMGPSPQPEPAPALAPVPAPVPPPVQKAPPVSEAPPAADSDSGSTFDNLEIVDSSLKGKLGISRVGSQVADNKTLTVFAGFKNKTSHKLSLEVMTIYKDGSGIALNAASWIPVTLKANEEREYRSSSITEQAVDFMIRIRRAQSPGHK